MEPIIDPRISVFYPSEAQAAYNLKNATQFSRINIRASFEDVKNALSATPSINNTFCFAHRNDLIVFDNDTEHHRHHLDTIFGKMLEPNGMTVDADHCAFGESTWTEAGFYIKPLGEEKKAFMVALQEVIEPEKEESMEPEKEETTLTGMKPLAKVDQHETLRGV